VGLFAVGPSVVGLLLLCCSPARPHRSGDGLAAEPVFSERWGSGEQGAADTQLRVLGAALVAVGASHPPRLQKAGRQRALLGTQTTRPLKVARGLHGGALRCSNPHCL